VDGDSDVELRVRGDIARHGWHVALVPPEAGTPGWALTIGLLERFDHPELVVFGPDLSVLGPLLNHLGGRVRDGERLGDGELRHQVLATHPVVFRAVAPKWIDVFLGNAAWHYRRRDFPALQVFWPDPAGRFPWDPAADPIWLQEQPLLFVEATHRALSERLVDVLRREGAL
jgi:hypothetical protein